MEKRMEFMKGQRSGRRILENGMAGAEQEIGYHCHGFGDRLCCGIFLL